ncbi:YIP1 family protein [Celeribacter sp.]|uniref:YIP1 family protein n=1 Tax=Celeribacter sp. TaxID=1890673 RepID=UPI003A93F467
MGVAADIIRTYRAPGAVVRHRLGPTENEGGALVTLMLACGLIFVAQWPRLSREAFVTGQEVQMLLGGALLAWLFMMPLVFYVLAAVLTAALNLMGGKASGYEGRMATFWPLLAASPLWLLWGLTMGFIGQGPAATITGALALVAFLIFWGAGLREVAFPRER